MEIRALKNPDFDSIFPLWQEAFGDSRPTAQRYFTAIVPYSTLFVILDENIPVSMLYSVEEQVSSHKISYIYAVATAKSHRGQGLAAKLLAFAEDSAREAGASACILCPAEPSLAAYYGRLGYESWSAAGKICGEGNTVPDAIRTLDGSETPVFAMAKIFDPSFPKIGTFRYSMG